MNKMISFTIAAMLGTLLMASPVMAAAMGDGGHYYKAAERYAAQSRPAEALAEYDKAIAKDAKKFEYWLGKGQTEIALGKFKSVAASLEQLDDLQDSKAQKFEWMLLSAQYKLAAKPKGWLGSAKQTFFKARDLAKKMDVERPDLYLMIARVYREAGKEKEARKHYSTVIAMGGPDAATANEELASIFRQAQASGTGKGWVGDLAKKETINRETLAVVLVDDVEVQGMFSERKKSVALPDDAKHSDYAAAIETILNIQMTTLGLDAKGRFNPDASVTRYELARLIEEILVVYAKKPELARAFIGTKSPYADVKKNHYAYNAVFLAISRGLMEPDNLIEGTFAGDKLVSGADLLLVLRKLGSLNR